MKIKTPNDQTVWQKRLWQLIHKRKFVFLGIFILYHLLMAGFIISIFYSEVPYSRRQKIMNSLKAEVNKKMNFRSAANKQKNLISKSKRLDIRLEPEHVGKLASIHTSFTEKGNLPSVNEFTFPAVLEYKGESSEIDLIWEPQPDLTSREKDGFGNFTVKVKSTNSILGGKCFSMYPVQDHNDLGEWLQSRLFAEFGLPSPSYDLIRLSINEQDEQIYVMKQTIENQLSEKLAPENQALGSLNDFYGMNLQEAVENLSISHPPARATAGGLWKDFQLNKLAIPEVFDIQKLADFFALLDFSGGQLPTSLDDLGCYFNPDKTLLELFIRRNSHLGLLEKNSLLGVQFQSNTLGEDNLHYDWRQPGAWVEKLFNDTEFYRYYLQALMRISSKDFTESLAEKYTEEYQAMQKMLAREFPIFNYDPFSILRQNQEYIKKALRPSKQIQAYYKQEWGTDEKLYFDIANIHFLPVEITGASINDTLILSAPDTPPVIQANSILTPVAYQTIPFLLPEHFPWTDSLVAGLKIHFRILGGNSILKDQVHPYSIINEDLLANDLMRRKSNIHDFDFLVVDDEQKQIRFKAGTHQLDNDLIIPADYQVFAQAGAKIDMINNANILSRSPLHFIGEEENPVAFYSSDSTAQGISVLNGGKESHLKYVYFDNLSNPMQSGWSLTSGITFYESPVKIEHCFFGNNRRGDDYLNIVRCSFSIDHAVFMNTNSDAFDGDFCQGTVKNTRFINVGNDAIDISGSKLAIEHIFIDYAGDKGISVGENSKLEGHTITIKNAEIAITSKDLSQMMIDNIDIQDCRIAYTAFQKKPEFGPASIVIKQKSLISGKHEILYLIENGSHMTIAGEPVKSSLGIDHVKQILYGVKFGKSSG